ncbi:hypothetical protein ICS_04037 [Bacillus cereus BAG2O-3]|uniref:hypothetical protein n=1 Tax=Bacillus sp. dmp10 TaxID=2293321 RepID=UPI000330B8B9|nr:hypothetical protein ICS_04037 [Bacillus cereus BAG2O-3]RFB46015.1 hypothetical protein DZB83_15770 [Bacillus sp. dmp10]
MEKPRRTYRSNGMTVTVIGELNCKLFAEKFVEIVREEIRNGEINPKDYIKTSKTEDPKGKKE